MGGPGHIDPETNLFTREEESEHESNYAVIPPDTVAIVRSLRLNIIYLAAALVGIFVVAVVFGIIQHRQIAAQAASIFALNNEMAALRSDLAAADRALRDITSRVRAVPPGSDAEARMLACINHNLLRPLIAQIGGQPPESMPPLPVGGLYGR